MRRLDKPSAAPAKTSRSRRVSFLHAASRHGSAQFDGADSRPADICERDRLAHFGFAKWPFEIIERAREDRLHNARNRRLLSIGKYRSL